MPSILKRLVGANLAQSIQDFQAFCRDRPSQVKTQKSSGALDISVLTVETSALTVCSTGESLYHRKMRPNRRNFILLPDYFPAAFLVKSNSLDPGIAP